MTHWNEAISARLENYSGYDVKWDTESLSVFCENPNSFEVSICELGDSFQVGFDGWHEHFDNLQTALDCFTFGLSTQCRLKVTLCGTAECAWTVQSQVGSNWEDDSTTGLLLIPFWRSKSVEFRHNVLLKLV